MLIACPLCVLERIHYSESHNLGETNSATTRLILHLLNNIRLTVHRIYTQLFREQEIAATARRVWNSLPPELRKQTCRTPGSGGR